MAEISETRKRGRNLLLLALAPPTFFAVCFAYRPYVHDGPVLCPTRWIAGFPCPGCGITRALCHLSHGEVEESLRFHPLAPLVVGYLVALWIYYLRFARRGTPPAWNTHRIAGAALFLMAAFYGGRLTMFFSSPRGWAALWNENVVARFFS
ncbi:MAG: DUF2752 domain-containing protein [Planctomycetes bacterium]|nr:DUF2752 domain-containing protein [Planctomycetota bacterium]